MQFCKSGPDKVRKEQLAALICSQEPVAQDVIGFMDGHSLNSECNSDAMEQKQCTASIVVIPLLTMFLDMVQMAVFCVDTTFWEFGTMVQFFQM
jgi:hypothetical protein